MITMEEAIDQVVEATSLIESSRVDLADARDRILAEDVHSDLNMPPFDKATMDGYAVIESDIKDTTKDNPRVLEVIEEIPAGSVPTTRNIRAPRRCRGAALPPSPERNV